MQPYLALSPNASTELPPSQMSLGYQSVSRTQQQCHLSHALEDISTDGKGVSVQERAIPSLGPHPTSRAGLHGRSSPVPTVPPSSHAVHSPITGTSETAHMSFPLWNKANCGVSFADHENASSFSSCPSSASSSFSSALHPPSQGLYACMSNGYAPDMHSSGINLAAGTNFLDRAASQPGCMDNHQKMYSDDGASTWNSGLATLLSSSSPPKHPQQEPYLSLSDNYHNVENLSFLIGSPMTDRSHVVSPNSLPMVDPFRDPTVPCGWEGDDGRVCYNPVSSDNLANHFATLHGIRNMASDIKVACRWCPSRSRKQVKRESILRHLREVHLKRPRPKKEATQFSSDFPPVELCSNDTLGVDVTGGMRSDILSDCTWPSTHTCSHLMLMADSGSLGILGNPLQDLCTT
ncbi:hypothetical protein EDD16DRAFT_1009616 [Pisolithus croceorrhizus]|nr:hypothetical protein EDD16DRAFT_1009616 [Pisolithus croceorrhizus]KAI6125211.1 hypothetical protein EV401DRAFT_1132305 [Pisolithus croceorrhizus]